MNPSCFSFGNEGAMAVCQVNLRDDNFCFVFSAMASPRFQNFEAAQARRAKVPSEKSPCKIPGISQGLLFFYDGQEL
jgi:hypothetical protein